jgi:hypothetical protein
LLARRRLLDPVSMRHEGGDGREDRRAMARLSPEVLADYLVEVGSKMPDFG